MDFGKLFSDLGESAAVLVPVLAIIVGLFIAWIVGRLGAFIVKRILVGAKVDERVSASLDTKTQITKWVSGFTFWALFIFVFVQLLVFAQSAIGVQTGRPSDLTFQSQGLAFAEKVALGDGTHKKNILLAAVARSKGKHAGGLFRDIDFKNHFVVGAAFL